MPSVVVWSRISVATKLALEAAALRKGTTLSREIAQRIEADPPVRVVPPKDPPPVVPHPVAALGYWLLSLPPDIRLTVIGLGEALVSYQGPSSLASRIPAELARTLSVNRTASDTPHTP